MSEDLKLDALYTIFEKHLYAFNDIEDSEMELLGKIVNDYVAFLKSKNIVIPRQWERQVIDELYDQVHNMLVKKIYGALSVQEFIRNQPTKKSKRRRIKKKYAKLF